MINKPLPSNIEAERSLLGAILLKNDCILDIIEEVTYQDFYNSNNQFLFKAMEELYKKNEPIDTITLMKVLPSNTVKPSYITDLLQVETYRNYKHHAKIVKELSNRRNIIKTLSDSILNAYTDDISIEEVLKGINTCLMSITSKKGKIHDINSIVELTLENVQKAYTSGGKTTGLESGLKDVDKITNGFKRKEVSIIAARPSCGKTAFTLNCMSNISNQYKTLMFQLEMGVEEIGYRLFSRESLVNGINIQRGRLNDSQWDSLVANLKNFEGKKFKVDDEGCLSWDTIESRIRKEHMQNGLDVVFIDHLGLIKVANKNRNVEIGDITNRAKMVAKELNIAIVFLSQLSRACEQRADHRPILSDLRDSGNIEQDADLIIFLYRDEYYNPDTEEKGVLEVITSKNRNGAIGLAKVFFDKECQFIADIML